MADLQNRTLICSVLFIDIVEYSRKPVVEQIELKDRFNALLSDALRGVAVNDRIILDTGDGAAISFIGDPEDALFVASGLRDEIASQAAASEFELSTRMGINLGPVRLVKDINGQPNIIGDGINVAQRVMSFAKPGQVLVSRSYYEVVSRLSDESSKLFSYEGSRTDKHIREHEVYAVGAIPEFHRRIDEASPSWSVTADAGRTLGLKRVSRKAKDIADEIAAKPRLATLIAVFAILVTAFGARAYREPLGYAGLPSLDMSTVLQDGRIAQDAVTPRAPELPPVPAPPAGSGARPEASTPSQPPSVPAAAPKRAERGVAAPASERKATTAPRQAETKRSTPVTLADAKPQAQPTEKSLPRAAEGELAVLSLAIAPWGQVYVDGRARGVSPPLQEVELTPGRHRIELKNNGAETHVVTVNAKPGERLRIKHKFN